MCSMREWNNRLKGFLELVLFLPNRDSPEFVKMAIFVLFYKFISQNFCTKKVRVKCWWNLHLVTSKVSIKWQFFICVLASNHDSDLTEIKVKATIFVHNIIQKIISSSFVRGKNCTIYLLLFNQIGKTCHFNGQMHRLFKWEVP